MLVSTIDQISFIIQDNIILKENKGVRIRENANILGIYLGGGLYIYKIYIKSIA